MFEHVGAHDGVIVPASEKRGQAGGFQVGNFHPAVMGLCVCGFGLVEGDAIAGAAARCAQVQAERTAAAAEIEHLAAWGHHACQNGKRAALLGADFALIKVQVFIAWRHVGIMTGLAWPKAVMAFAATMAGFAGAAEAAARTVT
ncbi:MAG: hypothetical protein U1E74_05715 [Paenacidovorax caeni]